MRANGCRAPRRCRRGRRRRGPRGGRLRRFGSLAGAATVALLWLLAAAPSAQAHAYLSGSSPRDGEVLESAPTRLRLDFSESVQLAASRITVVDGSGRSVEPTALRLVPGGEASATTHDPDQPGDPDEPDTEQPVSLVAEVPHLPRGAYHVAWETVSSDDLHRTSGVLAFGIGDAVAPVGLSESLPEGPEVVGRWILLGGVGLALGAGLAAHLLIQDVRDERARSRLRRRAALLGAAGAAVAAGTAVALLGAELARSGIGVLTSAYAAKWALREAGLGLLLGGLWLLARADRGVPRSSRSSGSAASSGSSRPARWGQVTVLGTALTCVGTVLLGHFGARGGLSWVAASSVHAAAGLAWAGAVGVLGLLLVMRRGLGVGAVELRPALRAFRRPAAAAVSIVAITGVYLASDVIGSIDAALVTAYGRILMLKLALAGGAGLLGWRTTRRVRSAPTLRPARAVVAEGLVLFAVLGAAGALAAGQPALQPELVSAGRAPTELLDGRVADLQESVAVRPNRPGDSVVLVDVHDTRRPSPGPVTAVVVTVGGGGSVAATRIADGRWAARARLGVPGDTLTTPATPTTLTTPTTPTTPIRVVVSRRGLPDVATTWSWTVGPTAAARPVLVSAAPIAGVLQVLAGGLLLGLTLVWWVGLERTRFRRLDVGVAARASERAAVRQ